MRMQAPTHPYTHVYTLTCRHTHTLRQTQTHTHNPYNTEVSLNGGRAMPQNVIDMVEEMLNIP